MLPCSSISGSQDDTVPQIWCHFLRVSKCSTPLIHWKTSNDEYSWMKRLQSLMQSSAYAFYKVLTSHCSAVKSGTIFDVYAANNILGGYVKCKELCNARWLFDEIPHRDNVTWNTMIAGYVNCGNLVNAWDMLKAMQRCALDVDGYTFGSVLKGVASACRLDVGQQVHSMIIRTGYELNVYAGSALLDMYAKCERMEDAYMVFECIPEPNSISWNAMIAGFCQLSECDTAFWLLECMEREGALVDDGTFAPLLTLLADPESYTIMMQVHCKTVKHGLALENTVFNAMITSYSECGAIADARKVFDGVIGMQDLVTWNSMLAAYLLHEKAELAFELFLVMQRLGFEPDIYTYTSILSACFERAPKNHGKCVHAMVIKRGLEQLVPVSNALITMYLKSNNKSMEDALSIFNSMERKDRISWNSILTGFSQMVFSEDALKFFRQMRNSLVEVDHYAFSAVLRSCSELATLQLGQQIHLLAIKLGFEVNSFVASALIFMYSKCGFIEYARKSFEETPKDCSITWNSMIFGYAQHGQGKSALDLFFLMRDKNVKFDHITFVAVLTACSHMGLIEEGWNLLKTMEENYGIPPRMEHYACAVDLFGRAGRLYEAKALIESMPFKPDGMVWKTLLGACRACGNIKLASQVASHLLELEPEEHSTYVLLSDMYGRLKKWDEKASVTRLMRERGVKKVPGWSWLEVENEVHAFNAEDRSHSHCDAIYQRLGELVDEIKWVDTGSGSDALICDVDDIRTDLTMIQSYTVSRSLKA